jgi:hypothetical protein
MSFINIIQEDRGAIAVEIDLDARYALTERRKLVANLFRAIGRDLLAAVRKIAREEIQGRGIVVFLDGDAPQVVEEPETLGQLIGATKLDAGPAEIAVLIELDPTAKSRAGLSRGIVRWLRAGCLAGACGRRRDEDSENDENDGKDRKSACSRHRA